MDKLLEQGVSVYVDDVALATWALQNHDIMLNEVFTRFKKYNSQVKLNKCVKLRRRSF